MALLIETAIPQSEGSQAFQSPSLRAHTLPIEWFEDTVEPGDEAVLHAGRTLQQRRAWTKPAARTDRGARAIYLIAGDAGVVVYAPIVAKLVLFLCQFQAGHHLAHGHLRIVGPEDPAIVVVVVPETGAFAKSLRK